MARLYWHAGCLTFKNGGLRPGQWVTIQKECADPWFHHTERFSHSVAPRCGVTKRCGNIGDICVVNPQACCKSTPLECWLGELTVAHFRGKVHFQLLDASQPQDNLTTVIKHYGATRRGINGMNSEVNAEDASLTINSADALTTQDTTIDHYINCRRSDIVVSLPGTLGVDEETPQTLAKQRKRRSLEEFPAITVTTSYGDVQLPPANQFEFSEINIRSKCGDLSYEALQAITLNFAVGCETCAEECHGTEAESSDGGALSLTGPRANHIRPGPPGALKRPQRFPLYIGFLWRFCMGAQGA
jgi:hypothetical protein